MKTGVWVVAVWLSWVSAFGNIGGYCAAVDVGGTNAYVGAGQILLEINVSDPASPACTETLNLPGLIEDILVSGSMVYAACGDAGVHAVDLGSMEITQSYDSPGHAYGLALAGSSLYLADGVSGLHRLDAATLVETGSFVTNAPAMDVVVAGSDVCLLDHFNGVIKLDSSLNVIGGYGMIAFGNRMVSDGSTLFAIDGEGKVSQIDIASMTLVTNELVGIPTVDVALSGAEVLVAREMAGVQVLGGVAVPVSGGASAMDVDSGRLYVAAGFGGLSIFDASTKALLGSWSGVSRSRASAVAGSYVYLAAGNQGVRIFDVSDPANPSFAGSVSSSNVVDVAAADGLLLAADLFRGVDVYDLSVPASPVYIGSCTSSLPLHCIGASGPVAYASDGYGVHRLDLSVPSSPAIGDSQVSADYVYDLDVCGTNVLLATSSGLVPLGGTSLPGTVHTISVDGSEGLADWSLVDLSNPLTPVSVTNFGPLVRAMQLTVLGETVYASADDGGTLFVPLPAVTSDSDGDGLDDDFEWLIIDHDSEDAFETLADIDPEGDFDGDGLSNVSEFFAGTVATDPDSVFAICGLEPDGAGHSVSWYSVAGHSYTIQKSTNLVEGFYILQEGIPASEPINAFIDSEMHDCAMYMITID